MTGQRAEANGTPGDGNIVDGGSVEDAPPIKLKGPFDVDKHRGYVTVLLIALLGFLIAGHYICVIVMEWNGKKTDSVNAAFNAALPIISGLVGSAVTYYFTSRK